MKKIMFILLISFLINNNSYALNFKYSIGEYEKINSGTEANMYVMNR